MSIELMSWNANVMNAPPAIMWPKIVSIKIIAK